MENKWGPLIPQRNLSHTSFKQENLSNFGEIEIRHCASLLTIPPQAFSVMPIYGFNGAKYDTFNNKTQMPYGFGYKVHVLDDDDLSSRIIEKDFENYKLSFDNERHLYNYYDFIEHYWDEIFFDYDDDDYIDNEYSSDCSDWSSSSSGYEDD